MKTGDLVRVGFVGTAIAGAREALAQGAQAGSSPSFAISSSGMWSMLALAIGVGVAIWAFRKVT
jgi:hypothetical protein